mmetsp:Transcript_128989/g.413172  ORF Transcript_128989/g.413172 Transcript_128989/m.413172 type:complete len:141 (-) Transcript_128989:128-550(-)
MEGSIGGRVSSAGCDRGLVAALIGCTCRRDNGEPDRCRRRGHEEPCEEGSAGRRCTACGPSAGILPKIRLTRCPSSHYFLVFCTGCAFKALSLEAWMLGRGRGVELTRRTFCDLMYSLPIHHSAQGGARFSEETWKPLFD